MATFYLRPPYGFTSVPWTDPARPASGGDPGAPSRITKRGGEQHRRWKCPVGSWEIDACQWDHASPILDTALDGRLYVAAWVEVPNMGTNLAQFPVLHQDTYLRSYEIHFSVTVLGHYVLGVRREREGHALFHFDVE